MTNFPEVEWLKEQFKSKKCDICGGDERDHTAVRMGGNILFALCQRPVTERYELQGRFYIVYPEDRYVSDSQMLSWAQDAIADEEIEGPESIGVVELAKQLQDAGLITLGKLELE